jgi:hypothetical protein
MFLLSKQLRELLKREVTNDSALLECMQQVQWAFGPTTTAGDALGCAISEIDDLVNVCDPTAENLAELADYRRREKRDSEAERQSVVQVNKFCFGVPA